MYEETHGWTKSTDKVRLIDIKGETYAEYTNQSESLIYKIFKAVKNSDIDAVKELMKNGFKLDDKISGQESKDNDTILNLAVRNGNVFFVKELLDLGANPNTCANSPLFNACFLEIAGLDDVAMLKLLLKYEANVNATDDYGKTPVFYVQSYTAAELLVNNGADVTFICPYDGSSAISVVLYFTKNNADEEEIKKVIDLYVKHKVDLNSFNKVQLHTCPR